MAKFIITNDLNFPVGLAANDSHKNVWLNLTDTYNAIEITENDFTNITTDKNSVLRVEGTNLIYEDRPEVDAAPSNYDEQNYLTHINQIKTKLNNFIDNFPDSQLKTDASVYLNYLNNTLNTSNISFPQNINFTKYLKDNNITFFHPLQIP